MTSQKVPEPLEISQVQTVKVITILGVTITNSLSVSPHVQLAIASSAQVLYALCVLRTHGLCDSALHTIYRSVVVAKLLYASCAWEGFANTTDWNKIQSFINKSKRNGYCSPDLPDINNLCTSMKVHLFNKVLKIPIHVLHPLLPPPPRHVIHSYMVYDPEYTTGLYQREPQTLWTVTSSSECYIWMHTD